MMRFMLHELMEGVKMRSLCKSCKIAQPLRIYGSRQSQACEIQVPPPARAAVFAKTTRLRVKEMLQTKN